ncbi:MAG: cysteine--tRNA ligase [Gammaproteobacteria bacterium]
MLQIYNSLTRKKESFKPIQPGKIGMYVCGMTVYDYCHIGHARVLVVFDVITRYLREQNYQVHYVRNITDIDDKIIQRALENQEPYFELTKRFTTALHEDERLLNVLPPDEEPLATQHIPEMIVMIQALLDKNVAYIADNGDVYYDVSRFPAYGQLAHQDLTKLQAGMRVDVVDVKHNPLDFVLWKMAKPNEPSWDSPWGKGRPGWHIECSAMSTHCLGKHFDIHGGGFDLLFPHHQNEIAQSEAADDCPFVNTWIHVGYVQINNEKMSKSLGNFFTIREVVKQYQPEIIRYFMFASHYRSPINYSTDNLISAQAALTRAYTTLRGLPVVKEIDFGEFRQQFQEAMDDDFNTPVALAVLFEMIREINRLKDDGDQTAAARLANGLKTLGNTLGILQQNPETFLQMGLSPEQINEIEQLIAARNAARKNKDYAEADRVRQTLLTMGITLEDTTSGTIWRRLPSEV